MRQRKQSGPISTFIFGVVVLLVGGAVAYFWGWPMLKEAKSSRSWPETPGKITISKIESHSRKGKRTYSAHVEYAYTVDGVDHTGNRVSVVNASSSSRMSAKRTVDRYAVGTQTPVYYNPDDPGSSVLHRGTTMMTYMPLGVGGLFFFIGVLMVGGSLWKLALGTVMIGAAATAAITKPPTQPNQFGQRNQSGTRNDLGPPNDFAPPQGRPASTHDHDDGIEIQ